MNPTEDPISVQLAVCAKLPRAPGPWVVLSRRLLEARRAAEAVGAAEKALALDHRHPGARAARKAAVEVLEAGEPGLTRLELKAALDPDDTDIHLELGHTYAELNRPADAERHFKRVMEINPDQRAAQAALAALYLGVGIKDGAEHYARQALEADPGNAVASQTLAALLEERGDADTAQALLNAAYGRNSLFVEPALDPQLAVLVLATQTQGNIPYRYLMPSGRYTRFIWYMEHARADQIATLPAYDLVFNAIGDADLGAGARAATDNFLAVCRRPVMNDPDKVARTSRHLTPARLGDVDDVVVPRTVQLDHRSITELGLVRAVTAAGLAAPVLVRPLGSHGGRHLVRADTVEMLAELDEEFAGEDVFVTEYRDYPSPDGRYRKGRMIFVDRQPYPYHWAVSDHWLVHYESAGMDGQADRQTEEHAFLTAPETVIGPSALAAITELGRRLDLDYCGLDFSILPDGQVLVFEANATMLVHPEEDDGELAYKNPAVRRIIAAFQAHLATTAQKP
jgi:tetratricopeptide (TPR) repeat protein